MVTAQKDLMRDDGVVLEAALQDAGVQVKRDRYMGMLHYFWFFSQLEKASFCMKNAIKGLEWVLNGRDEGGLAINEI